MLVWFIFLCLFRFEKCKLNGMVREFEEPESNTEEVKIKKNAEEVKISDETELSAGSKLSNFELVLTNNSYVDIPMRGPEEVGKLYFYVDLFRVQKVVQPIGLPNIIPIVEYSKNRKPFPQDVAKTLIKVSNCHNTQSNSIEVVMTM